MRFSMITGEPYSGKLACTVRREIPRKPNMATYQGAGILPYLKLINVISFLHQYQRKIKKIKLENNDVLEYIECTVNDYKIAYELLKDGLLDNTLDDLPRPARELLELIKKFVKDKSVENSIPVDKVVFERKDIREYTSWSFAQVRNNIRILKEYEYLQIIKSKSGLAHQYKLSSNYSDLVFLNK